jgi:hypothetical protein
MSLPEAAVNAVRSGLAPLPVKPGLKRPECILTRAEYRAADKAAKYAARDAGRKDWINAWHGDTVGCGYKHHITTEVQAREVFERLTAKCPDLNLSIEVGKSRVIVVDADTPEEVLGFTTWWRENTGETISPTVRSPGVITDGVATHSDGGHTYFQLPDGFDADEIRTTALPGGATAYVKARIVLVPPSRRAEGPYEAVGDIRPAPTFLLDAVRRAERVKPVSEYTGDSPIDTWKVNTTWDELLEPAEWVPTRQTGSCGCPRWLRPGGGASSDNSAIAHEGCAYGHFLMLLSSAVFPEWTNRKGERAMSKLDFVAETYHGGDTHAAMAALGLVEDFDIDTLIGADEAVEPVTRSEIVREKPAEGRPQMISGAAFLFDHDEDPEPLWGDGDSVLWANGEGLMVAAVQGVGKSTLAGQLVFSMLGIVDDKVLGFTVKPAKRVLYLAMDRPRQLRRAFSRVVSEEHRGVLEDRLVIWQGPPPKDLAKDDDELTRLAEIADADVVVVDSLKDAALKLSDDETGSGWNRALQKLIQSGRNLLVLHHQRKRPRGDKDGTGLDDLYGSTWLTSGMGSVIYLDGGPGDPVVKLRQLKIPAEEVGPFSILHDQKAGLMSVEKQPDLLHATRTVGRMTRRHAAQVLFADGDEKYAPTDSEKAKASRKLIALVQRGLLREEKDGTTAVYVADDLIT